MPEYPESISSDQVDEDKRRRQVLMDFLDTAKDKNFVFFYGAAGSGKSTVLGSMLYSMKQSEEKWKLYVRGTGDYFFQQGLMLFKHILDAFGNGHFLSRTKGGSTTQLLVSYHPDSINDALDMIFLEMSGEDLWDIRISPYGYHVLPFHIDIILNIPNIKIIFVLTSSWREARNDDSEMSKFINMLYEKNSSLIKNRLFFLITKWDEKKKENDEDIFYFVKREMPLTFSRLNFEKTSIQPFSAGNVITVSPDGTPHPEDIIIPDIAAGQRLFEKIYETFTESHSARKMPRRGITMDIVTSAIAGALGNLSSNVVQHTYNWLKNLLLHKFGAESEVAEAVKRLEQKPDSEGRKGTLSEEVQAAGADKDTEILKAAEALRAAVEAQATKGGTVVNQYVIGGSGHTFTQSGPVIVKH